MMIDGGKSVCVVEFKNGALHCDGFESRLLMVLAALNSGSLSGGVYGGNLHLMALREVIAEAQKIISNIEIVATAFSRRNP